MALEGEEDKPRKTIKVPKTGGLGFWGFGHCQGNKGIGETLAEIYGVDVIFEDEPPDASAMADKESTNRRPRRKK